MIKKQLKLRKVLITFINNMAVYSLMRDDVFNEIPNSEVHYFVGDQEFVKIQNLLEGI